MVQVIIPISDCNTFFNKEEYFFPKPIIEVLSKPLIVQIISQLEKVLEPDCFIFVIPKEIEINFSLTNIISLSTNIPTKFVIKNSETSGGLSSCLLAIDKILDEEIVIANMDEIIDYNLKYIIQDFRLRKASAGVIVFNSSHPRWSYGIVDADNNIEFCVEKKVISKFAFAGFYYFESKELFINSCSKVLLEEDSLNNRFYISSALNQIILMNKNVCSFKINSSNHHSLFSPEMIKEFESSKFALKLRDDQSKSDSVNIVIPAAGKGSRFSNEGWKAPKPLIEINGKPMIQNVIDNLAIPNSKIHIVVQDTHNFENINLSSNISSNINKISIDFNSAGTACTVLHARNFFENNEPLLIANSDQIVDFDCSLFINDCLNRVLDGSILVFKDKQKDPKWSFAKVNSSGLVEEVAEKKPISNLATVGIYFFSKGIDFVDAAIDMINHDDRTNGEFYTCPVYNYLIKKKKKIGIFEIEADAMHGIGTPRDLSRFLLKKNIPDSIHKPN